MRVLSDAAVGAASPVTGARALLANGLRDRRWMLIGLAPIVLVSGLVLLLTVVRGVLYPIFDPGPYDESWGGPSLAGAWTVHVLIGVLSATVAILVLAGLGRLVSRFGAEQPGAGSRLIVTVLSVLGLGVLALWVTTQLVPALT